MTETSLVPLEVFDHPTEVAGVGELEHDVELIVLDEGGEVFDYVGVVQLLESAKLQFHLSLSLSLFLLHLSSPGKEIRIRRK